MTEGRDEPMTCWHGYKADEECPACDMVEIAMRADEDIPTEVTR